MSPSCTASDPQHPPQRLSDPALPQTYRDQHPIALSPRPSSLIRSAIPHPFGGFGLTKEQLKAANADLTKKQRNYRYRKETIRLSLGIIPFMNLYPDTHTTELFIAAHRWPGGKATCPNCGPEDTDLFGYLPSQEPHNPQFLTQVETGHSFGWDCQDCDDTFNVVTGTLIETPRVPPGDWLSLANTMLIHRNGDYQLDPAHRLAES